MKTINERVTVRMESDFVVFIIGMRINRLWKFWKWMPVMQAMPKMLQELSANPDTGFLSSEFAFGRTFTLIQYWRSVEDLNRYAVDRNSEHLPAWRDFNRKIGTNGDIGIFHETYPVSKNAYEVIYANMPKFGLGKVFASVPAHGKLETAKSRMNG